MSGTTPLEGSLFSLHRNLKDAPSFTPKSQQTTTPTQHQDTPSNSASTKLNPNATSFVPKTTPVNRGQSPSPSSTTPVLLLDPRNSQRVQGFLQKHTSSSPPVLLLDPRNFQRVQGILQKRNLFVPLNLKKEWTTTHKLRRGLLLRNSIMLYSVPLTSREIRIRILSLEDSLTTGTLKGKTQEERSATKKQIESIKRTVVKCKKSGDRTYSYLDLLSFQPSTTDPPAGFNPAALPKITEEDILKTLSTHEKNDPERGRFSRSNKQLRQFVQDISSTALTPEDHIKRAQFVLNEISPATFELLLPELFLHIVDQHCLESVIDDLIAKAIAEHKYHALYAELCKRLIHLEARLGSAWMDSASSASSESAAHSRFQTLLLTRSRDKLTKERQFRITPEEKLTEAQIQERIEIHDLNIRGIASFLGNLVNARVIDVAGMTEILEQLKHENTPDNPIESDLLAFKYFIETIGHFVQKTPEGKAMLKTQIDWLFTIVKADKMSKRTKFLLMDTFDTYSQQTFKPYTSEQIVHIEAPEKMAESSLTKQLMGKDAQATRKADAAESTADADKPKGKKNKGKKAKAQPDDDGWEEMAGPKTRAPPKAQPKPKAKPKQQKNGAENKGKAQNAKKAAAAPADSDEENFAAGDNEWDLLMNDDDLESIREREKAEHARRMKQRQDQAEKQKKERQKQPKPQIVAASAPEKGKSQVADEDLNLDEKQKGEEIPSATQVVQPLRSHSPKRTPRTGRSPSPFQHLVSKPATDSPFTADPHSDVAHQLHIALFNLLRNKVSASAAGASHTQAKAHQAVHFATNAASTFETRIEALLYHFTHEAEATIPVVDAIRVVFQWALAEAITHPVSADEPPRLSALTFEKETAAEPPRYDVRFIHSIARLFADTPEHTQLAITALLSLVFELNERRRLHAESQAQLEKAFLAKNAPSQADEALAEQSRQIEGVASALHQLSGLNIPSFSLPTENTMIQYIAPIDAALENSHKYLATKTAQTGDSAAPVDKHTIIDSIPLPPLDTELLRGSPHMIPGIPESAGRIYDLNPVVHSCLEELIVALLSRALANKVTSLPMIATLGQPQFLAFNHRHILSILRYTFEASEGPVDKRMFQPLNDTAFPSLLSLFTGVPAETANYSELLYTQLLSKVNNITELYDLIQDTRTTEQLNDFFAQVTINHCAQSITSFLGQSATPAAAAAAASSDSSAPIEYAQFETAVKALKPQTFIQHARTDLHIKDPNLITAPILVVAFIRTLLTASHSASAPSTTSLPTEEVITRLCTLMPAALPIISQLTAAISSTNDSPAVVANKGAALLVSLCRDYSSFASSFKDFIHNWNASDNLVALAQSLPILTSIIPELTPQPSKSKSDQHTKRVTLSSSLEVVFRFLQTPTLDATSTETKAMAPLKRLFAFEAFEAALLTRRDNDIGVLLSSFTSSIRQIQDSRKMEAGDDDWD